MPYSFTAPQTKQENQLSKVYNITPSREQIAHKEAQILAQKLIGNNSLQLLNSHPKDLIYKKVLPNQPYDLYKSYQPLNLKTKLPDRAQNVKQDPLTKKAMKIVLDSLLEQATSKNQKLQKQYLDKERKQMYQKFYQQLKANQEKRRSKGLSDSGSELLQNILASQHQTNQLSSVSHEVEQMNQKEKWKH